MTTPLAPRFAFELPVHVSFGDGALGDLPDVIERLDGRTIAAFAEPPVASLEPVAAALDACRERGAHVDLCVKEPGEPTFSAAEAAAERLREQRPDVLVAVGGGSTIDLVKAARLLLQQGGPLARFLQEPIGEPSLPLVAVPTTSGTGSEVSLDAVLTDDATHMKVGFNAPGLRAQHALVDPLLTLTLPPAATAYAGIDALAQAIGGVITTRSNPASISLGLEACHLVGRSLERAVADGSDLSARRDLAAASLLAGLAMSISECSAEHSVGQAIGGLLGAPHGLTIGAVLAETLEVNRPECADLLERVADALGEAADDAGERGSRAVAAVRRLLAATRFPTLSDVGVTNAHVDELVARSLRDDFVRWNPHAWTEQDFRNVYSSALALESR
jgi:alcohol dehydrogenase